MNALVVYDSTHGNTAQIAEAISEAIDARVLRAGQVDRDELTGFDLLIVGSPTHGGWFTEEIRDLVKALPALEGTKVAAFDTRTKRSIFGFAAPRIARSIEKKGGVLLVPPEGFVVRGIKGPLVEGELERAVCWAKEIGG